MSTIIELLPDTLRETGIIGTVVAALYVLTRIACGG
jgi:hypothetical protein